MLGIDPTDPFYGPYAWNLHNTGSNAYQKAATAGADVDAPTGWAVTHGQGTVVAVVGCSSTRTTRISRAPCGPTPPRRTPSDLPSSSRIGDTTHGTELLDRQPGHRQRRGRAPRTAVSGGRADADNGQGSVGLAPGTQIVPLVGSRRSVDGDVPRRAGHPVRGRQQRRRRPAPRSAEPSPRLSPALSAAIDYATDRGWSWSPLRETTLPTGTPRRSTPRVPAWRLRCCSPVSSSTPTDSVAAHSAYGATTVDLFAPGEEVIADAVERRRLPRGRGHLVRRHASASLSQRSTGASTRTRPSRTCARTSSPTSAHLATSMAGRSITGGRLDIAAVRARPGSVRYTSLRGDGRHAGRPAPRGDRDVRCRRSVYQAVRAQRCSSTARSGRSRNGTDHARAPLTTDDTRPGDRRPRRPGLPGLPRSLLVLDEGRSGSPCRSCSTASR